MPKEQFIKLMQELIAIRKDEENLNKAFKKFNPDFNYISFGRYETLVVKALKAATNDKYGDISYWIYDLEEGKEAKKDTLKSKEGKNIPIKTLSNLYDVIKGGY